MTIFGWDMSHFDSPSIGNAVSQGISFITHKAGGDTSTGDPELGAWWAGVKSLPQSVVLGAYWVLRPDLMKSAADEADRFLARLDAVCKGWRSRDAFILQLDAEEWNSNPATRPSIGECNSFCDQLVRRTQKYVPIGYLPAWVYGNVSTFRYPLWASRYVSGSGGFKSLYPGDSWSGWSSYGSPVKILQYSSKATVGGQTTCDANAYRGTVAQLKELVTPGGDSMAFIDTQDDFNKAMNAWAASTQGKLLIGNACWDHMETDPLSTATPPGQGRMGGWVRMMESRNLGRFNTTLAAIQGIDDTADVSAIVSGVLAGLDPAAIAAAIPENIAQQVAAELSTRLAS